MIGTIHWLILGIIIILLIIAIAITIYTRRKGKKHEPDYYSFFIMGIIWTPLGLIFENLRFFFFIGLIFLILGLANKDKWKKIKELGKR